jgi:Zn-dependent M28 family amino/carboxypeptidase
MDGNGENPGTYIVGGHYDASASRESNYDFFWQYRQAQGADDNATGVAATMEMARILSDPSNNFNNKDHIRFIAFAAEEYHPEHAAYHHLGSLWDAKKMNQSGENILGVTILDMIGYNPNYDYIEVITDINSTWLADSVLVNGSRYVPELITNNHPLPDVPYSDHESYQEYGFPAILLMENDAPWNNDLPYYTSNGNYHTTNDKIETVNFSQCTKVTQIALATIAELTIENNVSALWNSRRKHIASALDVSPNPFNSVTKIHYSLPAPEQIRIRIFDILGREVYRLVDGYQFAGSHEVRWNAKNMQGRDVASGMYMLTFETSREILTRKLFYVR